MSEQKINRSQSLIIPAQAGTPLDSRFRGNNKNFSTQVRLCIAFLLLICLLFPVSGFAQEGSGPIEVNGDVMEYSMDGNVVEIQGNATVDNGEMKMYADKIEFHRSTSMAYANGNVRLITKDGDITAKSLEMNMTTMKGEFNGARIYAEPYFGAGKTIAKVGENQLDMYDGYMTTSDFDKPEFRIQSEEINIFPEDKLVAKRVTFRIGDFPILYLPKFVQRLDDKRPRVSLTPGQSKDWGSFMLSSWRYWINDYLKGALRLDWRSRLGWGTGLDVDYKTPNWGKGIVKIYYTGENDKERKPERKVIERFKGEWRHKWDIDDKTTAIWQYYRISDSEFLKDYFERESDDDSSPDTFFLITRTFDKGTLSFRTDKRINRYESIVERLPEIRFDSSNSEIGESGFYMQNDASAVRLVKKGAAPSALRLDTTRVDINNRISRPMKVGIIEFTPFVGQQNTYYEKTLDPNKYNSIRGIFKTGARLQTKFYRIFDAHLDEWGFDINRLRHIITPTIDYDYTSDPTLKPSQLDQFDGIDSIDRLHRITFSLENKLQTKRDRKSVELLRTVFSAPFVLKEDASKSGFSKVNADMEFRPTNWFTLYFDSEYDTKRDLFSTINFDSYINNGDKWSFGFGKRYSKDADDVINTEFSYKINQKWLFKTFHRMDIDNKEVEEQSYSLFRDLHTWELEMNVHADKGEGTEFLLLFHLKAHPDIGFDVGQTFNRPKRGSN